MKILRPAIPFTERWYARPITCPHCYSEFMFDEEDQSQNRQYLPDVYARTFELTADGLLGICPSCRSAIYVEKPT